jgi:hypothetical protein
VVAIQQCQILLHRPCSRQIEVPESSLIEVTSASINLIQTALRLSLTGGFVSAFELANTAFQAGMILLYALRNHSVELENSALVEESNHAMKTLNNLFVCNRGL